MSVTRGRQYRFPLPPSSVVRLAACANMNEGECARVAEDPARERAQPQCRFEVTGPFDLLKRADLRWPPAEFAGFIEGAQRVADSKWCAIRLRTLSGFSRQSASSAPLHFRPAPPARASDQNRQAETRRGSVAQHSKRESAVARSERRGRSTARSNILSSRFSHKHPSAGPKSILQSSRRQGAARFMDEQYFGGASKRPCSSCPELIEYRI
jgi:hypothetical protein